MSCALGGLGTSIIVRLLLFVAPAQAGAQCCFCTKSPKTLDSRLCGNDGHRVALSNPPSTWIAVPVMYLPLEETSNAARLA
ncbi:MAG: hypothetical protein E6H64_12885, partial [Betaproteobacteria bacterium]